MNVLQQANFGNLLDRTVQSALSPGPTTKSNIWLVREKLFRATSGYKDRKLREAYSDFKSRAEDQTVLPLRKLQNERAG